MYYCIHCGNSFDRADAKNYDPCTGLWEEYCPNCGSEDFEEAEQCAICGEWHKVDYLENGVCDECIDKGIGDTLKLMRFAVEDDTFSSEELDEMIHNGTLKRDLKRLARDNRDNFAEFLKKEEKKDD